MADTAHEPRLITETGIDQRIAEIIELIHAAPTAWISPPKFEARLAIQIRL